MKEFIEKLIGRLEELLPFTTMSGDYIRKKDVIEIVNQLAEEYKPCNKPSCKDCEVYDKEKHYCPKWCEVIKHTTSELAEEYNNDFCEWKKVVIDSTELIREPHRMYLFKESDDKWEYCPYCGKKIKIAPYQPKGE